MPRKKINTFENIGKIVDERFDQIDKRFNQIDKRFEQVDKRFEQMDKRLSRVEFEMIDMKVTQGQMLSTLKEISEQQKIMSTQVINLVTTVEGVKQEVTAIGERVRQHEDKLEILS